MGTLVVYDSVFGNTEKVARAMAGAFAKVDDCVVVKADAFSPDRLRGRGRLVVGSPTRAFRPTPAVVAMLKALPDGALAGVDVMAFDTRVDIDRAPGILRFLAGIFGYAAEPIARRLQRQGGTLVLPPLGFVVDGSEGPLRAGELERAKEAADRASER